jgi:hypothetical protein
MPAPISTRKPLDIKQAKDTCPTKARIMMTLYEAAPQFYYRPWTGASAVTIVADEHEAVELWTRIEATVEKWYQEVNNGKSQDS